MKTKTLALVAAMAVGTLAHAQEAEQWRVEDGGNGHWYGTTPAALSWSLQQEWCVSQGGHLATLTSEQEWQWVRQSLPVTEKFVGASQDHSDPNYAEPSGGWEWVTGEAFVVTGYMAMFDDCPGGTEGQCGCVGDGNQDVLFYTGCCNNQLDDVGDGVVAGCDSISRQGVIEWSADCNGDGIVDYGQCRDGSLPDYNGNNIPDCCEQGLPCEVGNYPVQWRVEDGGNGHWYAVVDFGDLGWDGSRTAAELAGGHLATLTSAEESSFVGAIEITNRGIHLGGIQFEPGPEPDGGWVWITGEVWSYTNWLDGEPNNSNGVEDRLYFASTSGYGDKWNDGGNYCGPCLDNLTAVEWSADCNGDGIVDYGQILDGTFADTNANGVPDTCECFADVNQDGVVNGADISAVLGFWGLTGKPLPAADITRDGIVDGADLAVLLGSWGPCQ